MLMPITCHVKLAHTSKSLHCKPTVTNSPLTSISALKVSQCVEVGTRFAGAIVYGTAVNLIMQNEDTCAALSTTPTHLCNAIWTRRGSRTISLRLQIQNNITMKPSHAMSIIHSIMLSSLVYPDWRNIIHTFAGPTGRL